MHVLSIGSSRRTRDEIATAEASASCGSFAFCDINVTRLAFIITLSAIRSIKAEKELSKISKRRVTFAFMEGKKYVRRMYLLNKFKFSCFYNYSIAYFSSLLLFTSNSFFNVERIETPPPPPHIIHANRYGACSFAL